MRGRRKRRRKRKRKRRCRRKKRKKRARRRKRRKEWVRKDLCDKCRYQLLKGPGGTVGRRCSDSPPSPGRPCHPEP